MELDQEKLTRNESERSRELAQRIRRELGPCSVQVLGGVGALESALEATGAVQPAEGALPELLVVVDPEGSPCRSNWPTGCCWCAAKKRCWPPAQSSWHSRACTAIFRGRAGAALCRRLCFAARTPRMQPGSWPDMRKNWTSYGSAWSWPSAPAKSRAASWSVCAATFR